MAITKKLEYENEYIRSMIWRHIKDEYEKMDNDRQAKVLRLIFETMGKI